MSVDRAPAGRLAELRRLDNAVYAAVVRSDTPRLDGAMRRLSRAADYSRLSIASSLLMSVAGGSRGRRAAVSGLAAVGLTSTVVNVALKPVGRRRRPPRDAHGIVPARRVRMPSSASFPSGHSASAFAFAVGAGRVLPAAGVPLRMLAAAVAYSRVHTGVHYPGDVIAGSLTGAIIADLSADTIDGLVSHIWTRLSSRSS